MREDSINPGVDSWRRNSPRRFVMMYLPQVDQHLSRKPSTSVPAYLLARCAH